jgi:hypothetical protein
MKSLGQVEYERILEDIYNTLPADDYDVAQENYKRFLHKYWKRQVDRTLTEEEKRYGEVWDAMSEEAKKMFITLQRDVYIDGILAVLYRLDGYKIYNDDLLVETESLMGEMQFDFEKKVGRS